ncbi:MAG: sigma-70 family RNA polymerase sigma factor [marine benthic group bacterium]|nr:sigma-70 family RNA polymerase sigma factor [Gemmatimonadota bacterium]
MDAGDEGSEKREVEISDDRRREFETEALPHLDALFGLALRLTGGDEARSEDLVQDAMLKAWRSWDRFETGTNCRAWLMTILRNGFINSYRRDRSGPVKVEFEEIAEGPGSGGLYDADPEGRVFDRLVNEHVLMAIEELPAEFRVPVVLADVEGMGYQEVADTMGIPVGTVKSRLYRGRKRLQASLHRFAVELGYLP